MSNTFGAWIRAEDRLPEHMMECLVLYKSRKRLYPAIALYMPDREEWHNLGAPTQHLTITHWMPLPDLPQEK